MIDRYVDYNLQGKRKWLVFYIWNAIWIWLSFIIGGVIKL